jgi:hypothetical protein
MKTRTKPTWSEISGPRRAAIIVTGIAQISLLIAALVDIRRRPADEVRGSKKLWTALAFVNFIGPISYFVFGRRR